MLLSPMAVPVIMTVHAIVQNILEYQRGFMVHLYRVGTQNQSAHPLIQHIYLSYRDVTYVKLDLLAQYMKGLIVD